MIFANVSSWHTEMAKRARKICDERSADRHETIAESMLMLAYLAGKRKDSSWNEMWDRPFYDESTASQHST